MSAEPAPNESTLGISEETLWGFCSTVAAEALEAVTQHLFYNQREYAAVLGDVAVDEFRKRVDEFIADIGPETRNQLLRISLMAITKALVPRIISDAENALAEAGLSVEIIGKDRPPVCKARSRRKR
jgi:aspartate aminotransferase-like enzyme